MADPSADQLAPIEAQINAHPAIRAYFASPRHGAMDWVRAVGQASRDLGIEIPHDYQPEQRDGQVKLEKRGFLQRNPWVMPALAVGAPLAAGLAAGALAPAATSAISGGGAGGVLPATTASSVGALVPATTGLSSAAVPSATGGILSTLGRYGQTASDIGELVSAGAQGQAEGRRADATADIHAASQNNRALVDAAQFNRDLPMTRAQQTARGDLMSSPTLQDARSTGSGRDIQFSGGVRPSSFGASTTQAGEELKRQALLKMMNPEADQLTPQITQPRSAGGVENALGATGTAMSILGAYNKVRGGR